MFKGPSSSGLTSCRGFIKKRAEKEKCADGSGQRATGKGKAASASIYSSLTKARESEHPAVTSKAQQQPDVQPHITDGIICRIHIYRIVYRIINRAIKHQNGADGLFFKTLFFFSGLFILNYSKGRRRDSSSNMPPNK